jgi:hypothetical protein
MGFMENEVTESETKLYHHHPFNGDIAWKHPFSNEQDHMNRNSR